LRNFKLDRMRSIVITEEPISEKARGIQTIEDRLYKAKATDIHVTVELQPEAYGLISELQVLSEPKNLGQGTIQTVITVGHLPNIAKLIARYRGKARVIAPPEAKEYVRNYALKALGEQPIQAIEKVE
jgi:proteasome accessory factor C